jgi:large repetitive protein
MKMAIQFAVRDSAGGLQRGTVTGEEEGNFIQVGAGDSISLNLSVANVVAYTQHGTDLVVTLVDGRAVVLAGYFNPAGGARGLYLSESDEIIEVMLTDSGSGGLLVSYLPIQPTEKWSPLDGLRFAESDITMEGYEVTDESGGMLVPAAALLLGAGVVALCGQSRRD